MAGVATEESGAGRSFERVSSGCQSSEALAEWRSSDQVENGTPSTSPPYWDSDDDDDGGPKPSELYGKYTWKIDKFSQINKRELRSNAFEVGGYKWYILIYPQGCDVCNHLSLFLCVANHDKLMPGWSHFAQFTIAVVNKDPKKSKYSDTLHRFWKKEHDWGWKKFMELSKVLDGFVESDTFIIKAQVQVIRQRVDRPFRCLDCQYRRELLRVYITNVEHICRRSVDERRDKLKKLINDKPTWSSFSAFWMGMDQSSKRRMSREKTESILKMAVKEFFVEKEVTSTLVMDSLYSGLKALEGSQNKGKKSKGKYLEAEELPAPIIRIEKDAFVLVGDVLPLLERAATEDLLPPPKDDKGPQNRTKDVAAGEEFNKDSIERDERRLTEVGRLTIEMYILAHIYGSKIDISYQEAVSLMRQEELIREEEAASADKEKKSKKKQGKQKRNNRKGKDKVRDDKASVIVQGKIDEDDSEVVDKQELLAAEPKIVVLEKTDGVEDVSDVSDSVECVPESSEVVRVDSEVDSEDTDTSEVHPPTEATSSSGISGLSSAQNGRSSSLVDDSSSSTCSSDSIPSVAMSVSHKANSRYQKNQKFQIREKTHQSKVTSDQSDWVNEECSHPSDPINASRSSKAVESKSQDRVVNGVERHVGKKEEVTGSLHRNSMEAPKNKAVAPVITPPTSPSKNNPSITPPKKPELKVNASNEPPLIIKKPPSNSPKQPDKPTPHSTNPKPDTQKFSTLKITEKPSGHQVHVSRPLSAPLIPGPRPTGPTVSSPTMVPTSSPILARSVSATGRLGPESTAAPSFVPQSYRSAIIGNNNNNAYSPNNNSGANPSIPYSQPVFSNPNQIRPGFSFGMVNHNNRPLWMEPAINNNNDNMQSFNLYHNNNNRVVQDHQIRQIPAMADEFPHLDIINDLLDDEISYQGGPGPHHHYLNRHASFPGTSYNHHEDGFFGYGGGASGSSSSYDHHVINNHSNQVAPTRPLYMNGLNLDSGLIPNQWQMAGSELPGLYHIPEYQNLNIGVNGYSVFRPSNGL